MHILLSKCNLKLLMIGYQTERVRRQLIYLELLQRKYYCQGFSLTGRVILFSGGHRRTHELDMVYLLVIPILRQKR